MRKHPALLEPMDMPDPFFPIKVHYVTGHEYGKCLFTPHWHEHFEVLYVVAGIIVVEINSMPYTLQAGDIAVVNSNDLHAGFCMSEDLVYYALIADLSLLHSQTPDSVDTKFITPLTQNRILFRSKIGADPEIGSIILSIYRELKQTELGYEISIKSHLYRMLTILIRQETEHAVPEEEYRARRNRLERFKPVLQHMELHYREPLSIELLASLAGLSRFHFSRLFKEITGHTVTQYLNGIRLRRAEYLLRNSDMTVTEIAYESGFRDIYYFSRKFKQMKRFSPTGARRSPE